MQEYKETTAKEDAIKLVETVRSYWIKRAEDSEKNKENPGSFVNFVLLKDAKWNKEVLIKALADDWNISDEDESAEMAEDKYPDVFVMKYQEYVITVSMIDTPVPGGEAEAYAQRNVRWTEAVEVTKSHKAHLMVAVLGGGKNPKIAGELLVKTVASCCKAADVLGIYGSEVVFQPQF